MDGWVGGWAGWVGRPFPPPCSFTPMGLLSNGPPRTHTIEDQFSYQKHVLDLLGCFSPHFGFHPLLAMGCEGGLVHHLMMRFSSSTAQQLKFANRFVRYRHIPHVNLVLDPLCLFFTAFGWWGGVISKGLARDLPMRFQPPRLKLVVHVGKHPFKQTINFFVTFQ